MNVKGTTTYKGTIEKNPTGDGILWWPTKERPYPHHGIVTMEELGAAEMLKKYVMGWVNLLASPPWRWKAKWINEFERYAETITDQHVKIHELSPCTKALYDALVAVFPMRSVSIRAVCFTLEKDRHYRFIFQDIMMAAKRGAMTKRPRRELLRLINLFLQRETRPRVRSLKWLMRLIVFLPGMGNIARRFALAVPFERYHMDNADLWAACSEGNQPNMSYHYAGFSKEKMLDIYQRI